MLKRTIIAVSIFASLAALAVAEDQKPAAVVPGAEVLTLSGEPTGDAKASLDDMLEAIRSRPNNPGSVLCVDLLPRYWEYVPGGREAARKALEGAIADKDVNGWAREKYSALLYDVRLADGDRASLGELVAARGYVRRWLAVGPFGHATRSILDEVFAPEVDLRAASPDPKARYQTRKGDMSFARVPYRALQVGVEFSRALRSTQGASYLVAQCDSPDEKDVVFSYEGPSSKIFVNRGLAATVDRHSKRLDGRVRFATKLHKGWNRIVLKTGEWTSFFALRISTRKGESVTDLKWEEGVAIHEVAAEPDAPNDVRPSWVVSELSRTSVAKGAAPEDRALYGYALVAAGLGEEGQAVIDEPAVQGPLEKKAWYQVLRAEAAELADHLPQTERRIAAKRAYREALKLDPKHAAVRRRLAEFELEDDKTKEGLAALEALLETWPNDHGTRLRLYNALMDKGYEKDAERILGELETARGAAGDASGAHLLKDATAIVAARARWTEHKGDRLALQKIWEKELELDKRSLWVYERRRDLAIAQGDKKAAREALDAEIAAAADMEDGEADVRRARLDRSLGERDAEIEHLSKALEARPEDLNLREQLARLIAERGTEADAKKSLALLDDLLELEPARVQAQALRTALKAQKDEFWKEWEFDGRDLVAGAPDSERFPNAATVCLFDQTVTRIRRDGSATEVIHQAWKILDDEGVEAMGKRPPTGDTMVVRVVTPAGEVLEPIRAGNSFEMPGLAPGSVIEHEYKVEHGPPDIHYTNGPWYLQDPNLKEPFVHSRWIVIAPKDMNLEVIEKNLEKANCKKTQYVKGDEVVRIWETFEQERIEPEPFMPPKEEFLPWVKLYERRTLEDLAGIYRDQALGRSYVTPSVQAKADEITKGLEGDSAKLKALYDWVKENIQKPQGGETAAQILAAKGGSQEVLLAAFLDAVKVPYKFALAGPSPDADYSTDWEHPEPWQFMRPLLRVEPRDGTRKWINPQGARYQPMDLLGPQLWGAPVFVIDGASGTLDILPRGNPIEAAAVTKLEVQLGKEGTAKATYSREERAPNAYGMKEAVKNASKQQIENHFGQVANRVFPTPKLKSWKTPSLDERGVPFSFVLELEAKKVVQSRGDGTLVLLPMLQTMDLKRSLGGKATRKFDLVFPTWFATRDSVSVDLGPYAAPRLPTDVQLESRFAQYSLVFARDGAKLRIERTLTFFPRRVTPSEYKSFLGFLDKVDAAERRPVIVEAVEPRRAGGSEER